MKRYLILTVICAGLAASASPGPVFCVESVRPDKILYAPGENGIVHLQLRNDDTSPQKARLAVIVLTELDDEQMVTERDVELNPHSTHVLDVPFVATGRFGHEIRATLQPAKSPANSASDFFAVSSNFFEVGIGYDPVRGTQSRKQRNIPDKMRRTYSNWAEFLFWAPCDWSTLVSPLPRWWSGQASYPEDENNLKELISLLHAQGIKAVAYTSCNPAGPFAWDLARRKPEWFFRDPQRGISGNYDVETLAHWNDPVWRAAKGTTKTTWYTVPVNLRNVEALDWGIDQIIASARHYDWDAVRFDGHYTIRGDDERSAWNMRRLKQRVGAQLPAFRFAFNYGRAPEWRDGVTHEMRDALANGGGYVQEGIRNWRYTDEAYTNWKQYATNELRIGRLIGTSGGSYHCIWQLGASQSPAQRLYKLIYGLIAGGHPMYGSHADVTEGCANWGAFMTRWSALLWDPAIQIAPDAAKRLTVTPASRLEWQPFVQERIISSSRKMLLVHLVNPPDGDEIATGRLPSPVKQPTSIRYRPEPGTKLQRAMLIRPDMEPYEQTLTDAAAEAGDYEVRVPSVQYWAIVVFEFSGAFHPPSSAQPGETTIDTSLPPNGGSAADAPNVLDPNKNANRFQSNGNGIWETDRPFSGHGIRKIIANSQVRDLSQDGGGASPFMGRPWMGPFRPGRYHVAAHLKYLLPVDGANKLELQYDIREGSLKKNLAAARLSAITPSEFHDYVLDVNLGHTALLSVNLYPVSKSARGTLFLDHIRIEPIETYTDAQLATADKAPSPPEKLSQPNGARPRRVLLVRGMFHEPYGVDQLKDVQFAHEPPSNYSELFKYDALVLCDVGVDTWQVSQRRLIEQWVKAGGRLIVLGGPYTLGQGGMGGTFLEDILPVVLKGPNEVVRCEPPLPVSLARPTNRGSSAAVFWRHDLTARPNAKVLAWAGEHPLAVTQSFGVGQTIVFTGTVLGETKPGGKQRAFWETELWQSLLQRMVFGHD